MSGDGTAAAKERAAGAAVERVDDGMIVGLGSGSTAGHAIDALGAAVDAGLDIVGIPTSYQAADRARAAGVPVRSLEDVTRIDVAIDGADQVSPDALIKGGGGAHTREKIIDGIAEDFIVVVDSSKHADPLDAPVPVEVLPDARGAVSRRLERLGGDPTVRTADAKSGPVVTDNGHLVIDVAFGSIADPAGLAMLLSTVPGVVGHGVFVDMADVVITGTDDDVRIDER